MDYVCWKYRYEIASKAIQYLSRYLYFIISGHLQSSISMLTLICCCAQNVHVVYSSNSILIYRQRHTSNGINMNSFVGNAAGKQNKLKHAMGQWPFFIQCQQITWPRFCFYETITRAKDQTISLSFLSNLTHKQRIEFVF